MPPSTRDEKDVLRGRMEALGPVFSDDPLLLTLEAEGHVLRIRLYGKDAWCDRRLLARIQRHTIDHLRREIEPVPAAEFLRFLAAWQHAVPARQLEGPQCRRRAQLAGSRRPRAWGACRCACAAIAPTGSTRSRSRAR
jgi:ATP-dependent Lhr-like helicase